MHSNVPFPLKKPNKPVMNRVIHSSKRNSLVHSEIEVSCKNSSLCNKKVIKFWKGIVFKWKGSTEFNNFLIGMVGQTLLGCSFCH